MPRCRAALPRLALLIAVALALVAMLHTRKASESHFLRTQRYEDVYYLPPPAWLGLFSLGHKEALADLIWLRSLIYFGDELQHRGNVEHIYQYTDAMLALDPYFKKVYQWVSACALYRTGNVTARDARRVIAYLERAIRVFPDDGELAWTLGANYLYELPPLLATREEKAEAKRRGLEHLKVAALRGAGPPWLALTHGDRARQARPARAGDRAPAGGLRPGLGPRAQGDDRAAARRACAARRSPKRCATRTKSSRPDASATSRTSTASCICWSASARRSTAPR